MKALRNNIELGNGIYTVPNIARILHLPQAKVRRWLSDFYDKRLGAIYEGQYSWKQNEITATNFLTLIEFYVFFQLRMQDISPTRILKAHQHMADSLETAYPFASYKILAGQKEIFFELDQNTIVHADQSRQIGIKEILSSFCSKIDFSENHIADRFWPMGKGHKIIVDPHQQFGQPTIEGTNINADIIFSMFESGESVSTIGVLYDITENEVNDAINFCKPANAA